ncbi:hypothetical protein C8J56DRAFT_793966 [Mycena floridula]|nr:hypothetical protein C8J56DRAFT_793966 [Mycena floridula]
MLAFLRPHALRRLYTSTSLIGPPDPISHLRPVIYDSSASKPPASVVNHPYSLAEFDPAPSDGLLVPNEQFWKMQRKHLHDFNNQFWLDSNTRFEAGKQAILDGLPSSAAPIDKERALSEFYKQWIMQEDSRTENYTREWRRRNVDLIFLEAKVRCQRLVRTLPLLRNVI